jgi:class 3 adenylate cyclase
VNLGDVMVDGEQIYGDGVNVATRLESLADPGGICISRTVHENIRNKLPLNYKGSRRASGILANGSMVGVLIPFTGAP